MTISDTIASFDMVRTREDLDKVKERIPPHYFYLEEVSVAIRRAKLFIDENTVAPHLYHGQNIEQVRSALATGNATMAKFWIDVDCHWHDGRYRDIDQETIRAIPEGGVEFRLKGEVCG